MRPGFRKLELGARYDVACIREDEWHSYSELRTKGFIEQELRGRQFSPARILNAGCGGSQIRHSDHLEVLLDLFCAPIAGRSTAICASVTQLPFPSNSFRCIICVGEVLGYCDPAKAISEFARVLSPSGLLICDFSSSISYRHGFTQSFGRTADLIVDKYNGTPENIWIYHPAYIRGILDHQGFILKSELGTHRWSALGRRFGIAPKLSLNLERWLRWLRIPKRFSDLTTIAAVRVTGE